MKIAILGVDVNRASCDPGLYYNEGSFEHMNARHLDETAQRIADFVAEARGKAERIAWAMQYSDTRPGHEKEYSIMEKGFHRVVPSPDEDDFLPKTQMSPYEEHKAYFDSLKAEGIDTVVLTGFYAEHCIYWTLDDLVDNGFKVIVPADLIAGRTPHNPMHAFSDFTREVYNGNIIFADSETTLDMLYEDEPDRVLPPARYTWNDMHQANYGSLGL